MMENNYAHYAQHDRSTPESLRYNLPSNRTGEACEAIVSGIDESLTDAVKRSWQWRLFAIRAGLDGELQRSEGMPTPATERYIDERTSIYYAPAPPGVIAAKALFRRRPRGSVRSLWRSSL